jgi:2-polyprenyl-3-methyl-5-hydroxy-6-metoxy-1,4-benzoquinol methylase
MNQNCRVKKMKANPLITCPYCHCSEILKKWDTGKKRTTITVLWCKNCGFGWQHPYPTEDELRNLYKNQGIYHEKIVDETQGGFPSRIKKLNHLKPEKGNILDIGSGMGHFIMNAQKAGWSVEGIEPRISTSDYCYKKFGIKVYNSFFEEWSQNRLYDVITLWDVVEHVSNPFHFIDKSIDMLTPGGLLAISIPNSSGLPAKCFKGNWRYVIAPHINYFTMMFIKKFLRERHLEILKMDHSMKVQSLFEGIISLFPGKIDTENIYQMTYQHAKCRDGNNFTPKNDMKSAMRKLVYKFNSLSYPLPIGDLVDIYCRKD